MSVKFPLEEAPAAKVPKPPPLPPPLPATAMPPPLPDDDAVALGGDEPVCPRCRGKLISPESLGWCQKCGYCRSLEEDKARVALERPAEQRRPVPSRFELLYYIARLPGWVWVLCCGVVAIVLFTYPPSRRLEPDCLERAIWCTAQLLGGLLLLWGTQFWTLLLVADKDDKLNAMDVFLTGRLWGVAVRQLPLTRWPICIAVWAVTLMVTALVFLGGLDHWLHYLPRSSSLPM
jgi:hypothetical protein